MSLATAAARSVFWAAIGSGTLAFVSFLTIIILAKLLGPADFGLAALALSFVQIITLFVEQPFNDAIIQRVGLERDHIDTAFWTNLAIACLLIGTCFFAHEAIAATFGEPQLPYLIEWLNLGVLFSALSSIPVAQLRREMRFRELTLRSVVSRVAGVIVAIVMAFEGYGVWSIIAQQVVTAIVGSVLVWSAGLPTPRLRFSRKHLDELATIGIPVLAAKFVFYASSRVYSIMIGYFLGTTALGYWNAGMRVVETISVLLSDAAESVGLAVFARHQSDLKTMRQGFYSASQLATLISLPIYAGMIVIAEEFVGLILGPQWLPSVPLIQIVAFSSITYFTFLFGDVMLTALGQPLWLLLLRVCNLVLNTVGLVLFHAWGLTAAAVVWTATCFITLPFMLVIIKRFVAIDFVSFFRNIATPFVAGGLMALLLVLIKQQVLWNSSYAARLGLIVTCGILIYPVMIRILSRDVFERFIGFARKAVLHEA